MLKNAIEFREIRSSDYSALEKIISDTWQYDRFSGPKLARQMSKLYLASCLASQTFTCVAVHNGETVGIVMGKNNKVDSVPMRYKIRQAMAVVSLLLTRKGRMVAKIFEGLDKLNEDLLKSGGQTFDAELAFFAVRSDQRGTGIGKELYLRFLDYLKTFEAEQFFLYTDSSCNYGFYEHQGLERLAEQEYSFKPYMNEEMTFYLYGQVEK